MINRCKENIQRLIQMPGSHILTSVRCRLCRLFCSFCKRSLSLHPKFFIRAPPTDHSWRISVLCTNSVTPVTLPTCVYLNHMRHTFYCVMCVCAHVCMCVLHVRICMCMFLSFIIENVECCCLATYLTMLFNMLSSILNWPSIFNVEIMHTGPPSFPAVSEKAR